jgi:3-hydroxyisobutyrate dehydrogenase-like beta-hydroxyacid dehydrogenase
MATPTSETSHATIAILSIGQMGLGIASLLLAHNYRVITNVSDRSKATQERAQSASIQTVDSDEELVKQADYILSIVPPRDAVATAQRVIDAIWEMGREGMKKEVHYLDLNAISPATTRKINASFAEHTPNVRFIDGGIIGGAPAQRKESKEWTKPGIPFSGPHALHAAPKSGDHLAQVLNTRYLDEKIGSASGLKCCFAALSKGFTALALQSFTTASSLGVYDALQDYLNTYSAAAGQRARDSVVACTGKAYRWIEEMNQIGECFGTEGGWEDQARVFREIAGVYQGLADVVEKRGVEGMGETAGVVKVLGEALKEK